MKTGLGRIVLLLALACAVDSTRGAAQFHADDDLGVVAAERWIGRALIVRGFPREDELKYDATGQPLDKTKPTDWTLAGFDLVKVARRVDGDLALDGFRVAIRYNAEQRIFERHRLKDENVRILLAAPSARGVDPALAAIFSVGIDPALQRSMPGYWSHYFLPTEEWPADALASQTVVGLTAKPSAGLVYPLVQKNSEPEFTPEALADRVHGVVQVLVAVDSRGVPLRIAIRQPLGYGLDARTVPPRNDRWRAGYGRDCGESDVSLGEPVGRKPAEHFSGDSGALPCGRAYRAMGRFLLGFRWG
jgi:hypothetical protein